MIDWTMTTSLPEEDAVMGGADVMDTAPPAALQFVVWQLVDSILPAGGFAHSQGVEAALHAGE